MILCATVAKLVLNLKYQNFRSVFLTNNQFDLNNIDYLTP